MSHTSGTDAAKMEWRLLAPVFSWVGWVCLRGLVIMTDVRSGYKTTALRNRTELSHMRGEGDYIALPWPSYVSLQEATSPAWVSVVLRWGGSWVLK